MVDNIPHTTSKLGDDMNMYNGLTGNQSATITNVRYLTLRNVLDRAYDQAAYGKGHKRHAQDQAFEDQPMQKLIQLYGVGFALGQAGKKAQESQRLDREAGIRELLGAINYLAGAIIAMERV